TAPISRPTLVRFGGGLLAATSGPDSTGASLGHDNGDLDASGRPKCSWTTEMLLSKRTTWQSRHLPRCPHERPPGCAAAARVSDLFKDVSQSYSVARGQISRDRSRLSGLRAQFYAAEGRVQIYARTFFRSDRGAARQLGGPELRDVCD